MISAHNPQRRALKGIAEEKAPETEREQKSDTEATDTRKRRTKPDDG